MAEVKKAIVPLDVVPAGETVLLQEIVGGRGIISRLAALGFTPGAPLTMVQNFGHGPLIVQVRDARIALGRGEARHILVQADEKTTARIDPRFVRRTFVSQSPDA
ncbi:MAG: FeoA family protein [Anaerolineae bacterium]